MFRKMPVVLALIVILITLFGNFIPNQVAQILFGISLTIKSMIICVLPLMIFTVLFSAISNLAGNASRIVLYIFFGVICSNFFTISVSQFLGNWIFNHDITLNMPSEGTELQGITIIEFPSIIPNYYAMLAGIITGLLLTKLSPKYCNPISDGFGMIVSIMMKIITMIIPLFVIGFVVKLQKDGVILQIIRNYGFIFLTILIAQFGYIILGYFVINKFNIGKTLVCLKNMLPAVISGFTTMSSMATLPLTIMGAEKNAHNKDLINTVVPATVTNHLIGDSIAIPCLIFAILKSYNMAAPDMMSYLIFTGYFVVACFSMGAIPGGGMIVMASIIEDYFGFSGEMISLATALYILFDPAITTSNILGNSLFSKVADTLMCRKQAKDN